MIKDRLSLLRAYSLGIVVEDKKRGSHDIQVCPIEDIPTLEVPIKDYKIKYEVELPDAQGILKKAKVESSAIITATWKPISQSNRITSPDVIKNETVLIYRYGDTEDYYWDTIFHEPHIRRLETVKHAFGNLKEPLVEWDDGSSYWHQFSTHDKRIELHTTDSDGEVVVYDVEMDMKAATVILKDNKGNFIELSSLDGKWHIKAMEVIILDAPKTIVTGDLIVGGSVTVGGSIGAQGPITSATSIGAPMISTAKLKVTGDIELGGDVVAIPSSPSPVPDPDPEP